MAEGDKKRAGWTGKQKLGVGCAGVFLLFVVALIVVPVPEEPAGDAAAPAAASNNGPALTKQWADGVADAVRGCDEASKRYAEVVAELGDGASVYDAYDVSASTRDACSNTADAVRAVAIPEGLTDEVGAKIEETVDACANAYAGKYLAADRSMEVFDGDMRPSKIAEVRDYANAAAAGVMVCALGLAQIGGGDEAAAASAE